jgi:hypothetical protein
LGQSTGGRLRRKVGLVEKLLAPALAPKRNEGAVRCAVRRFPFIGTRRERVAMVVKALSAVIPIPLADSHFFGEIQTLR